MKLRFNGQHVMRTGQRLILGTKPKTKTKKEDTVKIQSISQHDRGRWSRLVTLVETFFSEQLAISGREDFKLSGNPKTELQIDTQERNLLTALWKVTIAHFNTGRDISTIEETQLPTNAAARQFAKDTIARLRDQDKSWAAEQPAPAPAVLLAKTETRKRVEDWYEKPGTIKTNVNGVQGMESYAPPPVLLAKPKEAE